MEVKKVSLYSVYARSPLSVPHDAPYLPQKFCLSIVFNFSWDGCNTRPGELKNKGYAKFGGKKGALWEMWKCVAYIKYLTLIKGILWSRGALSSRTS